MTTATTTGVRVCGMCGCETPAARCDVCGAVGVAPKAAGAGPADLEALTVRCTAFRTWAEFEAALGAGYVPTIYPRDRSHRLLAKWLREDGWRVYDGAGVR